MAKFNKDAVVVALLVSGVVLALLFAGQVWSYAARWAGRAVAGTAQILLAVGLAYATYKLYSGWQAAEDSSHSSFETEADEEPSIDDITDDYVGGSLTEEELDKELDEIIE